MVAPINHIRSLYRLILVGLVLCTSCTCQNSQNTSESTDEILRVSKSFELDVDKTKSAINFIAEKPHPFGSDRQTEIYQWISEQSEKNGAIVSKLEFSADTPNPILLADPSAPANLTTKISGQNILARLTKTADTKCLVLFGSHYDSKKIAGFDYIGANDSGSSSALLLEIMRYVSSLDPYPYECDLGFIWFDGEEAILPEWSDGLNKHPAKIQDNTYGSRHFSNELTKCAFDEKPAFCIEADSKKIPLVSLILLDMVGSDNIKISLDSLSSKKQTDLLKLANEKIGDKNTLSTTSRGIEDDHVPFRKKNISAIDIIDFNHLQYWHKPGDNPDKISYQSIDFAGKIAIFLALSNASSPKDFLEDPDN